MPSTADLTHSQARVAFHIPSLDGLRAISILIVFLSHAGLSHIVPGVFGVTVFFFLSGFLITTLMRMEAERTGTLNLSNFYLRRVIRIFPPFFLVLGIIALLGSNGWLGESFSWSAMAAQALFVSNYWEIGGGQQPWGSEVMWSLAIEEHFYLLFPLCYLGLRRWLPERRHQFTALLGMTVVVLAWRWLLVHVMGGIDLASGGSHHPRTCHGTDTRLDGLLFGCALALFGNPVLDPARTSRRATLLLWLPISVVIMLATFTVRDVAFRETWRYWVQGLALMPVFVAVIRYADWGPFQVLNWGWVKRLGVLSYSFYLVHSLVIECVKHHTPWSKPGQGLASFVLSFGMAWLIHEFIERPCVRLRQRFGGVK
jgi:peptidoglycan/LPS O-acetylase OafA/YrhL